jgi:hypothetical protein
MFALHMQGATILHPTSGKKEKYIDVASSLDASYYRKWFEF